MERIRRVIDHNGGEILEETPVETDVLVRAAKKRVDGE